MTRGFVWTILALAILTAFPVNSFAIKIATVDMATIYKNYQEVRKSQAFLKEKKDEYQHLIDKQKYTLKEEELALQNLKEDLRQNKGKYTPDLVKKKENEQRRLVQSWQKKFQGMKGKFENYKVKLEDMEKKEFQNIRRKVDNAVNNVAGRLGIDLVIEKQWIYYGNTIDITQHVLKQLEGHQ